MSRGKAITLLSLISVLLTIVMVFTFVPFSVDAIREYQSAVGAIELDYDLEGGIAYTLTLADDNEGEVEDINEVIKTIENRLDALGYSVYSIKAIKSADKDVIDYDIRIETKLTSNTPNDIAVVAAYGSVKVYGGGEANPTEEILTDVKAIKTAKYLGAYTDYSNNTYYQTSIEFTAEGYHALHELMHSEEEYYIQIKLGDNVLLGGDSPINESYFTNNTLVVNANSEASAKQMALQISSGGLNVKYDIDDGVDITSPFGANVGTKLYIGIAALVLVIMIAFIVIYKGLGWVSALSLLGFILAEIWMMIAVPGIVVSMGGVLGIVASTILAALGMIFTCSRVKEECSYTEKTVKAALSKGLKQSLIPIINMNVIAGIVAICMFIFAKGAVKCFAITFGIGAVISAIASLALFRMFVAIILPTIKNKEKFLNVKKEEA